MTERFKLSLSGMWLLVSLFALLFPVFVPSFADSPNPASNVIGTATATMFILSFPSSLFGLLFLVFTNASIGVDPNSIQGMYVNLFLLFVLGLIQWFWIVPRIWRRDPSVQTIEIPVGFPKPVLQKPIPDEIFTVYDRQERTPVERVIREDTPPNDNSNF